jgi:hypothetical protein
MQAVRVIPGAILLTAAVVALPSTTAPRAAATDPSVNGVYRAFSDGQWAQSNDSYWEERSVTSTWTITSTCTDPLDCTGRVVSDAGWTADLFYKTNMWWAEHQVDNWAPCPDGTAVPGQQRFQFFPDPLNTQNYEGWDTTLGPSGACGHNQWLNIRMPFSLTKIR